MANIQALHFGESEVLVYNRPVEYAPFPPVGVVERGGSGRSAAPFYCSRGVAAN